MNVEIIAISIIIIIFAGYVYNLLKCYFVSGKQLFNFQYNIYSNKIQFKEDCIFVYKSYPFTNDYYVFICDKTRLKKLLKDNQVNVNRRGIKRIFQSDVQGACIKNYQTIFIWFNKETTEEVIIHEFSHMADYVFQINSVNFYEKEKYQYFLAKHIGAFLYNIRKQKGIHY